MKSDSEAWRGKVVVVTGAGSGLGRSICRHVANHGASLVAADLDLERAQETVAELAPAGRSAIAAAVDVADESQVTALIRRIFDSQGRIDYLFNNAGIAMNGEFQDMTQADFRKIMDVNFWGVIYGCRAVYPLMMQQGSGHIVNVSSMAGLIPGGLMTAYAAAKHAVVGFSYNLRSEARQYGIKVTALCPGYLDTPMHATATNRSAYVQRHDAEYLAKPHPYPSADQAITHMMHGVLRNRAIVVSPRAQLPFWWLFRATPELVPWAWERVIKRIKQKHDVPQDRKSPA